MDWIKRNLGFVIGGVVALALLGGAGWYNYTRYTKYSEAKEKLNGAYAELKRLHGQTPSPGNDKVDNIKNAREQEAEVKVMLNKLGKYFQPIPPVVNFIQNTNTGTITVTGEDYAAALRQVIDLLQKEAASGSVLLPPRYKFSFEAQSSLIKFAPGLERLAEQLAEVRVLVSTLNRAKVNSIDSLRRERVSEDDNKGPVTDYLDRVSVTNELAVLTPYELTFRCFSPELAAVLLGFASSPHSIVVKGFNVEPAAGAGGIDPATGLPMPLPEVSYGAPPVIPTYVVPQQPAPAVRAEADVFAQRYGRGKGGLTPPPSYGTAPPPVVPTVMAPAQPKVQTVLDERQLKVTMLVYVIKLLPPKRGN